jgi:hypothetical protein
VPRQTVIPFYYEMRAVGVRLKAAWDDDDTHHEVDWGDS